MQTMAQQNPIFTWLALAAGFVVIILTGGLAILFIVKVLDGSIDLSRLISEPNGDASMSRLQLLIFTFVIALSLFLIIIANSPPAFPGSIPADLLTLLGISSSSYLVSKGIQFSNPAGLARPGIALSPGAIKIPTGSQAPVSFTAAVVSNATASVPPITWSLDSPSYGTLSPSGSQATYTPDPTAPVDTKITLRAQVSGYDDGLARITYIAPDAAPVPPVAAA